MEHLVLAREGQLVGMAPHGLGVINLSSDLLPSTCASFLEHGEGIEDKFVTLPASVPELSAGIVGRTACDPVLLPLQVSIKDLRAKERNFNSACDDIVRIQEGLATGISMQLPLA